MKKTDKIKKALRSAPPKAPDWREGLSLGSTLLNLACTGHSEVGVLPGSYLFFVGDSDSGKAQPLNCKVLTPHGWKKMGEMRVGDEVIDPDGGFGKVVAVHPQGMKKVYCITLSDGTSTRCSQDHLWLVENQNDRARGTTRIKTTAEIREWLGRNGHKSETYHIPVSSPVKYTSSEKELPIPPYLLGVLLGNGCFGKDFVRISSQEYEIVERVRSLLPPNHGLSNYKVGDWGVVSSEHHKNIVLNVLREFRLAGCKAERKFIPEEYLHAPIAGRIQLLQGLMDTDGYATKLGTMEYTTVSEKLMRGICTLIRSLGGVASVSLKETTFTYKGERRKGQPAYTIFLSLHPGIEGFTLKRKKDRIKKRKTKKSHKIVGAEYVGIEECQCITVSTTRGLYVTDDFIVTHNSYVSLTCLAEATLNPKYKEYRFIHDNVEGGTLMNIAHYFGREVEERLEMPSPKGPSSTVEEFYFNMDNALKVGKPFIYVLDSMDSLTTGKEEEKFDEDKEAHEKGKAPSGSYGVSKARENSRNLGVICSRLRKTGSILIAICQTRDNFGFGAKFNPKTRSGGNALTFYADLELWSSVREQIYKPVRGNKCHIGSIIRVKVRRSRYTGQKPIVQIPLLWSHGIDDVGGCIDYLLEWKHWKEKDGVITAPEWTIEMPREELIQFIDQGGLEGALRDVVEDVWKEIEKAVTPTRKNRYNGNDEGEG